MPEPTTYDEVEREADADPRRPGWDEYRAEVRDEYRSYCDGSEK